MPKTIEGNITAMGLKLGIVVVVSRFNEFITGKLLDGAQDTLARHGVKEADVDVACADLGEDPAGGLFSP
jgi:6,7-dimethyl-8-ribityllumazine synthase